VLSLLCLPKIVILQTKLNYATFFCCWVTTCGSRYFKSYFSDCFKMYFTIYMGFFYFMSNFFRSFLPIAVKPFPPETFTANIRPRLPTSLPSAFTKSRPWVNGGLRGWSIHVSFFTPICNHKFKNIDLEISADIFSSIWQRPLKRIFSILRN